MSDLDCISDLNGFSSNQEFVITDGTIDKEKHFPTTGSCNLHGRNEHIFLVALKDCLSLDLTSPLLKLFFYPIIRICIYGRRVFFSKEFKN